jgi:nucleoside-diphosphate-sugar epimerase
MSSVLVTGAGGYVGRHAAAALVRAGHEVRGTWRSRRPDVPGVRWAEVADVVTADWAPLLAGVEVVVHAAGLAHVPERVADPGRMFRVNAHAVGRLGRAAAAAGVARVVLVSTIAVVGDTAPAPVTVDTPCRPEGAYGASKLEGERLLRVALAGSATEWTVLRPPLVYGPGAPGNLARLARLVRTGVPLPFGSVDNRRSFVAVDNLTDVMVRLVPGRHANGAVFLVADDEAVSTPALIRLLAGAMGVPARLVPLPLAALRGLGRAGDALSAVARRPVPVDSAVVRRLTGTLVVDATAVRSALDWVPPVTLEDGIAAAFAPQAGGGPADP